MYENFTTLTHRLDLIENQYNPNMKKVIAHYGEINWKNYRLSKIIFTETDGDDLDMCCCSKPIKQIFNVWNFKEQSYLKIGNKCIRRFTKHENKDEVDSCLKRAIVKYKKEKNPDMYCCLCDTNRKIDEITLKSQKHLLKKYHKKCNPWGKKICSVKNCTRFIKGHQSWKTKCLKCYYN